VALRSIFAAWSRPTRPFVRFDSSRREEEVTRLEIEVAGGDTATPLNLKKRLHLIRDVGDPIRGKRIIDCGCGAGEYVRALGESGASIVGIEFQKSKFLDAETENSSRPITLSAADIQNMPFRHARRLLEAVGSARSPLRSPRDRPDLVPILGTQLLALGAQATAAGAAVLRRHGPVVPSGGEISRFQPSGHLTGR
jgi:SAM-dependent methyltransferase